jgi:hypothetical protein
VGDRRKGRRGRDHQSLSRDHSSLNRDHQGLSWGHLLKNQAVEYQENQVVESLENQEAG